MLHLLMLSAAVLLTWSSPAQAAREDCLNLLALRFAYEAEASPLPDCSHTAITAPVPEYTLCQDLTPNECAVHYWRDAEELPLWEEGAGKLLAEWGPKCSDGSDSCDYDDRIMCIDGSRTVYWIEYAEEPTDNWVIYMPGGDMCNVKVDPSDGTETSLADVCVGNYFGAFGFEKVRNQMSSISRGAARPGQGILNNNAPFGDFNRVMLHKCSFDAFAGHRSWPDQVSSHGDRFRIDFDGREVIRATMNHLGIGSQSKVLLVGSSATAGGIAQTVDWISNQFPGTDVRALLASLNKPGPAIETRCTELDCSAASNWPGGDPYFGTSFWDRIGSWDNRTFLPGGRLAQGFDAHHDSIPDASCEAMHPSDSWKCLDGPHVAADHLTSPVFVYQSLSDGSIGNPHHFASLINFDENDDGTVPRWNKVHFKPRIVAMMRSLGTEGVDGGMREELFNTTFTPEPFGYFMVDTGVHNIVVTPYQWWLAACMEDPYGHEVNVLMAARYWWEGNRVWAIDGDGTWTRTLECTGPGASGLPLP